MPPRHQRSAWETGPLRQTLELPREASSYPSQLRRELIEVPLLRSWNLRPGLVAFGDGREEHAPGELRPAGMFGEVIVVWNLWIGSR